MPRRSFVVLTIAFSCATIAAAQEGPQPGQISASAVGGQFFFVDRFVPERMNATEVLARMMSFDRNGDGKIARTELPERMQPMLNEGDNNRDGVLDETEIRALARRPVTAATDRGFGHPGGYAFGDQIGVSTRAHVEGAIDDLRLETPTRDRALAVARQFLAAHESEASDRLLSEVAGMLTSEKLAEVGNALERSKGERVIAFEPPNGADPRVRLLLSAGTSVELDGLTPAQRSKVIETVARFRPFRLDEGDRAALVGQLKGILNAEERDDFRAALERRPLVKSGFAAGIALGTDSSGVPSPNRNLVRPAILVTPPVTIR